MIGRNENCWCGSGKKYKKCHLLEDMNKKSEKVKSKSNRYIKTPDEIVGMRRAGGFNGELMDYIRPYVKAGITTEYLNNLVHQYTIDHGHIPACLNYKGFPKSVCISVNEVVCHGIPSQDQIIKEGDIVNIDLTTIVDSFYGDSSETFMIEPVSEEARHVTRVAAQALLRGIEAVCPGESLGIIGRTIQPFVESQKCSVVKQFTGHGIGTKFHESFSVCHHITSEFDSVILHPGMTFTIEPMVNVGTYKVVVDKVDRWTVRTRDNSLSAQFEHTVLVTDTGAEVLTLTPSQLQTGQLLNLPFNE